MDRQEIIKYLLFTLFLAMAAYTDVRYRRISNRLLLVMGLVALVTTLYTGEIYVYVLAFAGVAIAALFFGIMYFTSKGGLGAGDVKLAVCMGMFVGAYDFINIMIYSLIYTVIVGIVCMAVGKVKGTYDKKTDLPFAPFILLGNITNIAYIVFYRGG